MLRLLILGLSLALVAGAILLAVRDGERVYTVRTPELKAPPAVVRVAQQEGVSEVPAEEKETSEKITIGGFRRPEGVPGYEILEEAETGRKDVLAARLLVDTRARSEAGYELITRDLKARYAAYDAVSVEYTDTTDVLSYNGGALIFNTPQGAYYMGYFYGPPNNRGYYVRAAE